MTSEPVNSISQRECLPTVVSPGIEGEGGREGGREAGRERRGREGRRERKGRESYIITLITLLPSFNT